MKSDQNIPRPPDALHKLSDEHRAQVWGMIEALSKGEVSYKEAREVLRQEKKALSAISKHVLRFKMNHAPQIKPAHPAVHVQKTPKVKKAAIQRASVPWRLS
jgi:hypothetical protein